MVRRKEKEMLELAVQGPERDQVEKETTAKAVEDAEDDQDPIQGEKVHSLRKRTSGTTCTTQ